LTLVAKRPDGTMIYASPSVQIPMPLELVEPEPDHAIVPGAEVVVSWTGGEGATHIAAFYADDLGEEQYLDVQKYGDVEAITIPEGIIREGGGIIGATALSGDSASFQTTAREEPVESSFFVHRDAAEYIQSQTILEGFRGGCPSGTKIGHAGICCPHFPNTKSTSNVICRREFKQINGAVFWGARRALDSKEYPPCKIRNGPWGYCLMYTMTWDHWNWQKGCLCPQK